MEVLKVTTVFVSDKQEDQIIHCSDGTSGAMMVKDSSETPTYEFKFYAHTHPAFSLSADEFHDGEELTLDDIMSKDQITLKFV